MKYYSTELTSPEFNQPVSPNGTKNTNNTPLIIVAVILGIVLIAGILLFVFKPKPKHYDVIGEWKSVDLVLLEDNVTQLLAEDAGLGTDVAKIIVNMLPFDDAQNITFTFTPSGKIMLGYNGGSAFSIGNITYEKLDNDQMILSYENEITVPYINYDIPINIMKTVTYSVTEDTLILDVDGQSIIFFK